eukprot:scaffold25398_cov63-Phaeocystis_antarctica.AAC.2
MSLSKPSLLHDLLLLDVVRCTMTDDIASTYELSRQWTMASASGAPFMAAWGAGIARAPTAAPRASRSRATWTA